MLVVYFSRAGENFNVGVVEEGSTAKLARMIARETGAGLVEIVPEHAYPERYEDAKVVIQRELDAQARPAVTLRAASPDIVDVERAVAEARVIALGYPIWCGHMPMPVRTLLDAHVVPASTAADGVTILPFCTNEGSGLARSLDDLREAAPDATVADGFPVLGSTVQHDPDAARALVHDWWNRVRPTI